MLSHASNHRMTPDAWQGTIPHQFGDIFGALPVPAPVAAQCDGF